jgi:putative transposase
MSSENLERKHPQRQPIFDARNLTPIIFLTVCTKDRKSLLANDVAHDALRSTWEQANAFLVGRYVILPDHVHLFCTPSSSETAPLANWIRFWKSQFSRDYRTIEPGKIWQSSFWDTQLRRGQHYSEKWDYVRGNPVRHGLVSHPEDWPYQGELNLFDWHYQ